MSATVTPPDTSVDRITLINDYGRIAISGVVIVGFAVLLVLSMTRVGTASPTVDAMLNTLGTLTTAVVMYWVGSSSGSTAKSATIAATKAPVVVAAPVAPVTP